MDLAATGRWTAALLLLALVAATPAQAKSYRVDSLQVQGEVQPDGGLRIREDLTFIFDGSFTFAYRDLPLAAGQAVDGLAVSEAGRPYSEAAGGGPGSFEVERRGDGIRITWRYRARDESRSFRLEYILRGAVSRYADTGEVYWKLVGEGWDRPLGQVDVELILPERATYGPVQAWAHGPLHGLVRPEAGGRVRFAVAPLPARTYFEGRVIFDADALAGMSPAGGERLPAILAEEEAWALEANRLREAREMRARRDRETRQRQAQWAGRLWPVATLLGLAALTVWLLLWRSHGRPYPVARLAVPGEIPSEHPPAMVGHLLTGQVGAAGVVATLLDLSRRGYYQVREEQVRRHGWFGGDKTETDYVFESTGRNVSDLLPFERQLLAFVHDLVDDAREFRMSALKAAASRQSSRMRRWFQKWSRRVARQVREAGLSEPTATRALALNALCGAVVAAAGLTISLASRSPAGLPALAAGFIQLVGTAALKRRTPEGRRLYLAWKDYGRHLKATARGRGPVSIASLEWERVLVYAVALGLHRPLGDLLGRALADNGSLAVFPWYHAAHGGGPGSIDGLAAGVTAMVGSVTSTMSSVSGTGGGASVGGGGGAGGGGGGAG